MIEPLYVGGIDWCWFYAKHKPAEWKISIEKKGNTILVTKL